MDNFEGIRKFQFNEKGLQELKSFHNGMNWPVIYLIHDKEDNIYIGETTSAATRMSQHLKNDEKNKLESIEIFFDNRFNKSVILDYEQRLIKCISVDGKFKNILNKNLGQQSLHDYYGRNEYRARFVEVWDKLLENNLANNKLNILENRYIFKYSPYNSLTAEQNNISIDVLDEILDTMKSDNDTCNVSLINGCAGTGKTVLAISIINSLVNSSQIDSSILQAISEEFNESYDEDKLRSILKIAEYINLKCDRKPFKIGFVFPMPGIRSTIKSVFAKYGNGLSPSMVIGPSDVIKDDYDILFVDESHRLSKRKNLTNYNGFDLTCNKLGLDKNKANQLDWILRSAKHVVLFYDEQQSVKSSDVTYEEYFNSLSYANKITRYNLQSQMRCEGGEEYIKYISNIMNCKQNNYLNILNYDFKIFNNVDDLVNYIKEKDSKIGLSKTVAGFSWEWKTKPENKPADNMEYLEKLKLRNEYDIEIDGYKYIWNLSNENWITREDSRETIGCIHTTQGFDMNYVGVIFGKEIDYDPINKKIVIDKNNFKDTKVKAATSFEELHKLIINTYTTIMARGIKGCYVYACNKNLRDYLTKYIPSS